MYLEKSYITQSAVKEILQNGVSKIAPLWSLENFVAVNPYLGLSDQKFSEAMSFLQKSGNTKATLPMDFYLEAINNGNITSGDLAKALDKNEFGYTKNVDQFVTSLKTVNALGDHVKIYADVADETLGKKWSRFMVDRISFWCSAYFDHKQAVWNTTSQKELGVFKAWKQEAEIDHSTELMGLKGFKKLIKRLPSDHLSAAMWALEILEIPEQSVELYINTLSMKVNGWLGFAGRIDWDANLANKESHVAEELLTIALVWEMCLKEILNSNSLEQSWTLAKKDMVTLSSSAKVNKHLANHLILQDAFDHANQRQIIEKINGQKALTPSKSTPKVQAIFCIDVRSELYRRNLEAANGEIATMGFAGFFAFPIKHLQLGHDHGTDQCPVLLTTSHTVQEALSDKKLEKAVIAKRTLKQHLAKAWYAFKSGAVTCFSFVSPIGLSYLPKLFTDAFGLTRPVPHPKEAGLPAELSSVKGVSLEEVESNNQLTGISPEDRLKMATNALNAMSLTDNFARIVLITGHGATTVNNPHATGLDCGACGGNSGESNAKVAAAVLNDPDVRAGLKLAGIDIPESTVFIAALHDTTTDNVTIFNKHTLPSTHKEDLKELEYALKIAGESARKERAVRMNLEGANAGQKVLNRSKDWSQIRPEWGLAGCSSFIVAPRERTSQVSFGGKAFMHSYDWKKDTGFGVLELIMTAPMVVTSWINLQYYASAVDNKKFGSGNKVLHNVVGGLGVLEGFSGDLRVGLPWQSVHDGSQYQHEPQRLNVIIEAPVDEMSKILSKHAAVKQLCDNEWIYLFAMNDEGKVAYKYIGNLEWELI